MRDDVTHIIDAFLKVCKVVHPDFENNEAIMAVYQQDSFEDLFQAIVDLNHTLVFFHIPTKIPQHCYRIPCCKYQIGLQGS